MVGAKIAAALVAFQKEMPTVVKERTATVPTKAGGQYTYTYADLADVMDKAAPVLTAHGLAFISHPEITEGRPTLVGALVHESGETVEGTLPLTGATDQAMGSSLTYARRYLLGCLTGIVTENDDDGARASRTPRARKKAEEVPEPGTTRKMSRPDTALSPAERKMFALLGQTERKDKQVALDYISQVVDRTITSRTDLTPDELSLVIKSLEAELEGDPHEA